MRTLRDRVALLGGTLEIDTAPGKGTLITIAIPLC
jgi:signal transduction histidine kinase